MATVLLRVNGATLWRLEHYLPLAWTLLFDVAAITESRRLFTTVFDGAARFSETRSRIPSGSPLAQLLAMFEEIEPQTFFREIGVTPDAVLELGLAELEAQASLRVESVAARWQEMLAAACAGNAERALAMLGKPMMNPLRLSGKRQLDARELSARAMEFHFDREERAKALLWLLFGEPVAREARRLTIRWMERAAALAYVGAPRRQS